MAGRVIDAAEGPLGEGSLELDCPDGSRLARAAIDENGWFDAPACPDTPTCARLIHPGSIQPQAWLLVAGESVELEVEPAPRLAGVVLAEGRPIAGALLIARRDQARWTTSTDAEGGFGLALAGEAFDRDPARERACEFEPGSSSGSVSVLVLAPDHRPLVTTISALTNADEELTLELAGPGPPLTGSLVDGEGHSFDRARVVAASLARPDEAHATVPDRQGRFEFTGLGEGDYRVRAVRDGVEVAIGEGRAGGDVALTSTWPARGPTLELVVHDPRDQPLVGARVDGGPFRAAHTDEAGRVLATDVFVGGYDLRVRRTDSECGVSRERIEIPPGEQGQTIRVDLSLACEPQ